MDQNSLLKTRKMKKSISIDQNQIKVLCDKVCDRIDDLLEHFNLEYRSNNRFISMSCPIHGGDNGGALNLYHTGESYRGNWKCRTHHCEETFKGSIIGFIRGIISNRKYGWNKQGDELCSFNEAMDYATSFLNISLKDIKVCSLEKEQKSFINNIKIFAKTNVEVGRIINRSTVRQGLEIPSKYFISRGFSSAVLDRYDVGECVSSNKEMSGRAVVPIYDMDYNSMIGCSGRAIGLEAKPKWRHSAGFKTEECLYNLWFAKEFIKTSGVVIIVESPGNVWKLEENHIHNSVALFGSNLTDRQKTLLDISGAMKLVLIMDSDEAGETARKQIYDKCYRTYNIDNIYVTKNDIAEMNSEEILTEITNKL